MFVDISITWNSLLLLLLVTHVQLAEYFCSSVGVLQAPAEQDQPNSEGQGRSPLLLARWFHCYTQSPLPSLQLMLENLRMGLDVSYSGMYMYFISDCDLSNLYLHHITLYICSLVPPSPSSLSTSPPPPLYTLTYTLCDVSDGYLCHCSHFSC